MSFLLRLYQNGVTRYPYISQGLQSSVLMALGDGIAQTAIEKKNLDNFDFRRSLNYLTVGFFGGIGLRKWYGMLQSKLNSPSKTMATIKRVSADQIVFAPVFLGVLISSIGLMQGTKPEEMTKKLKREYPDILIANYKLWPAVQLFNFYFIPLNYQVILVQVVAVAWNTYISFKTSNYVAN